MDIKNSYLTKARLRRKKNSRIFQKAYPDNTEIVEKQAINTFPENCYDTSDFRLAVKRTRPKTLHDAVTAAVQEEGLRLTEREMCKMEYRNRQVFHMRGSKGRSSFRDRWSGYRGRGKGYGTRGIKGDHKTNKAEQMNGGQPDGSLYSMGRVKVAYSKQKNYKC